MLGLVPYLFVISTSVIDCLGRFVPEMTYYVSSGTLNLTKLKLNFDQYNTSRLCLSSTFISEMTEKCRVGCKTLLTLQSTLSTV